MDHIALNFTSEDATESRLVLPQSSLTAEHVTLPSGVAYEYTILGTDNYIALHDIVLNDGKILTNTNASTGARDLRGKITFLPAGMPLQGWGDPKARRNSFTAIHFGADAIPEPLARSSVWERERVWFNDARLAVTLAKLDRALHAGEPFMRLLGETLCDLAIIEMASGHQTHSRPVRDKPTLRPSDTRRVKEYIVAHLADDISLSDLARVVGLSKFYFCRAYKASTGCSPYQAILAMRIEIAREILIGGMSIQTAAARTGFVNLSQFSRTFKQFTGLSPSAFSKLAN